MKCVHSQIVALFLILFSITGGWSQNSNNLLDSTEISILTCRSGDELYSTFGHTAIRIQNDATGEDYVYNYGLFSFDTPNFYPKFMRGQLPYFLGATKFKYFIREYTFEERSIFEQKLILNQAQKRAIIEFLADNARPENRAYKYDFFYDNCATRVVDVYGLAGEISYDLAVEDKTFRDLLKENLKNLVWSDFGIDLVIGARADIQTNRRHQMFLPEYVMDNLAAAKVDGTNPLARPAELILDYEDLNQKRKTRGTHWPMICTGILFLIMFLINVRQNKFTRPLNKIFLILCAALGVFLLLMWFGTDHGATRDNWNVLWLNPLIFVFLFAKDKFRLYTTYFLIGCLIVSALNCMYTLLPQFFNLAFLPIIMSELLILYFGLQEWKNKN